MTIAGEARVWERLSDQKLSPKCSTPLHSATAARRSHCPGGGRLMKADSSSTSRHRRSAVNSSGGNSSSASFEVMKLPAQARQTSETNARSRPPRVATRPEVMSSVAQAEPLVKLAQGPHRPDQQEGQVGEEARTVSFVDVADELADPRHHEHANRRPQQHAHAELAGDPEVQPGEA